MPMIMTHGWPGSVFELLKAIGPLTDPTAHGASADDAFHVVVPSLPGFGFSGRPAETGSGSDHIARAWGELMARLGYTRFVSQGGDCGSVISHRMAMQRVQGLAGIHVNMPATVPPDIAMLLATDSRHRSGNTRTATSRCSACRDRQTCADASVHGPACAAQPRNVRFRARF